MIGRIDLPSHDRFCLWLDSIRQQHSRFGSVGFEDFETLAFAA